MTTEAAPTNTDTLIRRGTVWDEYDFVIGIDPGFGATGIVIIAEGRIVDATAIKPKMGECDASRMWEIRGGCERLVFDADIDARNRVLCSIEKNHSTSGRSAQSMLLQRELIGVLRLWAYERGYDEAMVAATSAKLDLAGSGGATKDDMVEAASAWPGWPRSLYKYEAEAMADALGAALAGIKKVEDK